ncbi:MAG: hypothetical protein WC250_00250 [Candidatus Paceibacterota bacterium]|jgi:outer membrane murein-binding lipoprotein Lpp
MRTYAIHRDILIRDLIWVLGAGILSLLLIYGFLVNNMVKSAVASEKMSSQLSELNGEVADLESRFIALDQTVTVELAQKLGFQNVDSVAYVAKTTLGRGLSFESSI